MVVSPSESGSPRTDRPAAGEFLDLAAKRLGDDLVAEADADQRLAGGVGWRG